MLCLLNASAKNYLHSAGLWAALALSAALGIICGIEFGPGGSADVQLLGGAPIVISVILAVMSVSKEWECRTFINKIAVGRTKAQVYLSELITGLSASAAVYAAFGLGFAAGHRDVFGKYALWLLRLGILMTLAGLSISALAIAVSFSAKSHNPALVISLAAVFAMLFFSELAGNFIYKNEIKTEFYTQIYARLEAGADVGMTPEPPGDIVSAEKLGRVKFLNALNPIGALDLYSGEALAYLEGRPPDGYERCPKGLPLCSAGLIAVFSMAGLWAFRGKNIE